MQSQPSTGKKLVSTAMPNGTLQLTLETVDIPAPAADEVVVRIEAAPINPSDLGMLLGPANPGSATLSGTPDRPVATLKIPEPALPAMQARLGKAVGVGFEGAGVVVAAGSSAAAQALLGRTVAVLADSLYCQFRCVSVDRCHVLPEGTTAMQGASFFINPLTALGMIETMRLENHHALVHTAAASNVGQMLNRLCIADGIDLVSIVRKPEQVSLLRGHGGVHVLNAASTTFEAELVQALSATKATIAFDAIGGGPLAGVILQSMEMAIAAGADLGRYGSTVQKQVYLYGGLDSRPTELRRNYGMAWGIGGWLVHNMLQRVGPAVAARLKSRVAAELTSTFQTNFSREVSLAGALQPENIAAYGLRATGDKFVINPTLDC